MQYEKNNDNIQFLAKLSGFAYLGVIIFALFAEPYVRGSNVFTNDVAKTALNIVQNENLWRLAMVSDVFTIACDLILASIFYILLRPISHTFSFMAAFFRVSAVTVLAAAAIFHYAPMFLVGDNPLNNSFTPAQTQNLIIFMIKLHNVTYHISLILFGINCVLLGALFYKSKKAQSDPRTFIARPQLCKTLLVAHRRYARDHFAWHRLILADAAHLSQHDRRGAAR